MNTGIASDQLRSIIERIEWLEEEKRTVVDQVKEVYAEVKGTVVDQVKEVYAEVKGTGFDIKALREIIKLRRKAADERAEEEAILELYKQAIGME